MAGALSFSTAFGYQLCLLSLLHLGCLFSCLAPASKQRRQPPPPPRRRKISPFSQSEPSPSAISQSHRRSSVPADPKSGSQTNKSSLSLSIRSYLRQLFFPGSNSVLQQNNQQQRPHSTAASLLGVNSPATDQAKQQQLRHYLLSPDKAFLPCGSPAKALVVAEACTVPSLVKRPSFASRTDIYPCAACGEVFNKVHLLDLHQAARHAFSEPSDGESGRNIVKIIFQSGWKGRGGRGANEAGGAPAIHRILKIHHSPRALARFEEYRDAVRSRAAAGGVDERCVVDGNERLRFYCTTFVCGLEQDGNLGTCDSPFCAVCGIVRHGFPGKDADGIATHASAWAAHASLPEDLEREFAFMLVRRVMLVCRVVAGRVAPGKAVPSGVVAETDDGGYEYDSVVAAAAGRDGGGAWSVEGELVVFNAWAMLPCFVIVYSCV